MKVIGINGSPRRGWNTSTLVKDALDGAESAGAEVEMVDLYDLDYSGCRSCFGCKRIGLEDHRCFVKDGLTDVLDRMRAADAVVVGSPVYYSEVTAGTVACLERFFFPYSTYSTDPATFCPRRIPTGFIYTMNAGPEYDVVQRPVYSHYEGIARNLLGVEPESYVAYNTWQYSDYDRYEHSIFDVEGKRRQREEQFPRDREACRAMGARLVGTARGL